jgi:hypothetical protein
MLDSLNLANPALFNFRLTTLAVSQEENVDGALLATGTALASVLVCVLLVM